jgi:hypothetical protein
MNEGVSSVKPEELAREPQHVERDRGYLAALAEEKRRRAVVALAEGLQHCVAPPVSSRSTSTRTQAISGSGVSPRRRLPPSARKHVVSALAELVAERPTERSRVRPGNVAVHDEMFNAEIISV